MPNVNALSRAELPVLIKEYADEGAFYQTTFGLARGNRALCADGEGAARRAMVLNFADQINDPGLRDVVTGLWKDGRKLRDHKRGALLADCLEPVFAHHIGGEPQRINESLLADATTTSGQRGAGEALQINQPGRSEGLEGIAPFAPFSRVAPVLGQDLVMVNYITGVGRVEAINDMRGGPELSADASQAQVKCVTYAVTTNTDPLRIAKAQFMSGQFQGYDLAEANDWLADQSFSERLGLSAMFGHTGHAFHGIIATGSDPGKGVDVDKASVSIASADAADIYDAISNVISTARSAVKVGKRVDTVTMSAAIADRLRTPAPSGGSYLLNLIDSFKSAGIVNWFEVPDFVVQADPDVGTAGQHYLIVGNIADPVMGARLMSMRTPVIMSFANGPRTETWRMAQFGGVWTGYRAYTHVARFGA